MAHFFMTSLFLEGNSNWTQAKWPLLGAKIAGDTTCTYIRVLGAHVKGGGGVYQPWILRRRNILLSTEQSKWLCLFTAGKKNMIIQTIKNAVRNNFSSFSRLYILNPTIFNIICWVAGSIISLTRHLMVEVLFW